MINHLTHSSGGCPFRRNRVNPGTLAETAEQADLEARHQTRGFDFWRTRWKPLSANQAIEMAARYRNFEARDGQGNWAPIGSFEELQGLIASLEQQASTPEALAQTGQATAERVAGVPPQAPAKDPTVGMLDFARGMLAHRDSPVGFLQEFHARYGNRFKVNTPTHGNFVFDLDSEVLKQALRNTDGGEDSWEKCPLQGHGAAFLLGKKNMFLSSGEDWAGVQGALKSHFSARTIHGPETNALLESIFDDHLDDLAARVKAANGELEIDPRLEMQLPILDVALQLFLDTKLSKAELVELREAFNTQMKSLPIETVNPFPVSLQHAPGQGELKRAHQLLNRVADRIVAQAKLEKKPDSIVTSLLEVTDPTTGQPLDDERLRHEVLSLMEAGHETTATLLGWTFTMLAREPQVYAHLADEVSKGFDDDGVMSVKELRGLDYAGQVVDESLRMYPPFYLFMRRAKEDTTAGGIDFKQGTTLVSTLYSAHRREDEWGVEKTGFPAHEFHPERFAAGGAKPTMAFGVGRRQCLGQALGRLEAGMMLAKFAERFDLA
ncbi:MAG: cytochrome P450, partial [Candidatus Eremiobacteraeota bacterium]|nr:cytochrome P450 [Candidatus Eremiobacteraeota bacterium]